MLILASADIHGEHSVYEWLVKIAEESKPDVLVLAGDLLGAPDSFDTIEESQRSDAEEIEGILRAIKLPILYLMGNDDMVELEPNSRNIRSVHKNKFDMTDANFVGYQFSLPFMGGIFEKSEDEIARDLDAIDSLVDDRTVLVTHSPAHGILDKGVLNESVGSVSILRLIQRRKPLLHIHGHIHQEFGKQGRHFNVAAAGRQRAVLINTSTMESQFVDESAI